jgi:hypothetical protein
VDKTSITSLLSAAHFDLESRAAFRNEVNLIKLQKVRVASRTGTSIDRLFAWANPPRRSGRATTPPPRSGRPARPLRPNRLEQVARLLYDHLAKTRSGADQLPAGQPDLINWGVVDADSLFNSSSSMSR